MIVSTASHQFVREQEGYLTAKGVKFLLKPFDIDDLINIVADALRYVSSAAEFADGEPEGK